ncbi:MAG TPA: PEP-CTERM sorting domain-containing protein [Leptolyngbyaceae cyanobacterium M33_DOE_097]|uniref:PEP-CTERM sorting domain-containing protein n=1 Tax=Oscillatoriales cyanobacterium SpSt-418 TaxID=2282169 RepID=A0A7C3PL09_9CYAN|nr:PEP-CTERM sorting domain-containing protein [Leptolyngbyaceae cyanobacterium M33_DOE_097]
MLAQFRNLLTVGFGVAIALSATPAQAFNITFDFSFIDADEDVSNDPQLSGSFFAEDANSNGRLDYSEFTAFTSLFTAPGESVTWALADLSADSYYVSPSNYLLASTNATGTFSSNSLPDLFSGGSAAAFTEVSTTFSYLDGSPLKFDPAVAVPEPMTITGLALAGAGLITARRRKQA